MEKDDYPFALAILLALTDPDEIARNAVSADAMKFISDLVTIRTRSDDRTKATELRIQKYLQKNTKN